MITQVRIGEGCQDTHLPVEAEGEVWEVPGEGEGPGTLQGRHRPILMRIEIEQRLATVDDEVSHR